MEDGDTRIRATGRAAGETVDTVYRNQSRSVLATLIRLLGDFDLAEEALHEAFKAALEQWPRDGVPANPRAWLVSTGRFKAIDAIRKRSRLEPLPDDLAGRLTTDGPEADPIDRDGVEDDRLRLIFTCCHPALALDAQVALTLREVCGLTTEEIARAFLTAAPTLAQRIVRAKAKIRNARIPYQVPSRADLPDRVDAVLRVVYLVFNEGYSASSGTEITRHDLSSEAISLGRLLFDLLPEPDVAGLVGLMLLHDSRRAARASPAGDLVLLEDQDRALWNREYIKEGTALVQRALAAGAVGPYTIQAAIAAVHANAAATEATDWRRDRRPVRSLGACRALPSNRIESRSGGGHARRSRDRSQAYRRDFGAGRPGELSSRPCREGGSLPPPGANRRSPNILSTSPESHPTSAGKAISRAATRGIKKISCRLSISL